MNVTTESEQKPDVVITISWEEAEILRTMMGTLVGGGSGRCFTDELYDHLGIIDVGTNSSIKFTGRFK